MNKLKETFKFDLTKNFIYYSIYANALFVNKRLYLLYNFWNKRKEFLWLKIRKKKDFFNLNYQGFFSLNFNIYRNSVQFDYFTKWSSSFTKLNDLIIKNFFDNGNKNKYLMEAVKFNDYLVFDNIFLNYNINDKKKFFYFNKNKFLLNFYFKLSKKNNLKYKYHFYIYLYNYFSLLNKNYYVHLYNWKSKYNKVFISNIMLYMKYIIKKKIIYLLNSYLLKKKYIISIIYFFFNKKNKYIANKIFNIKFINKNNFFFRNFLKRKNNLHDFLRFKLFFQYLYFYKKINKHFNRGFIKFSNRFKKFNLDTKKFFFLKLKKKFFAIYKNSIYKKFKNRNFFSFCSKWKRENFFLRNFYKLNSLTYKLSLKNKKITKNIFRKKKKKVLEYRILKKLKTFYYIPDRKKTRQRVYSRFKKSVMYKFKKRKIRRWDCIYFGNRFNLVVYNSRNRYKNKMKFIELKKQSTPKYFFFKNRKNNYMNYRYNKLQISYKEIPNFIINKYNLIISKKKKFYKRREFKLIKYFSKLKKKDLNRYKKDWVILYNNSIYGKKFAYIYNRLKQLYNKRKPKKHLIKQFKKHNYKLINKFKKIDRKNLINYFNDLKKGWNLFKLKKKRMKTKKFAIYNDYIDKNLKRRKKGFWFYQKFLLYWRNISLINRNQKSLNLNYINFFFYNFRLINKNIFIISIKLIQWLTFYSFFKRKKKKYFYWFIFNFIYLFKIYIFFFLRFLKFFKRLKKSIYKINLVRRLNREKYKFFEFKKLYEEKYKRKITYYKYKMKIKKVKLKETVKEKKRKKKFKYYKKNKNKNENRQFDNKNKVWNLVWIKKDKKNEKKRNNLL